jgi:hypothetical protein
VQQHQRGIQIRPKIQFTPHPAPSSPAAVAFSGTTNNVVSLKRCCGDQSRYLLEFGAEIPPEVAQLMVLVGLARLASSAVSSVALSATGKNFPSEKARPAARKTP